MERGVPRVQNKEIKGTETHWIVRLPDHTQVPQCRQLGRTLRQKTGALWSSDQPKIRDRPFHTEGSQPNTQPHQSSQKLGQASPITSELPISFLVPHSYTEDQIGMLKEHLEGNKLQTAEKPTNQPVNILQD